MRDPRPEDRLLRHGRDLRRAADRVPAVVGSANALDQGLYQIDARYTGALLGGCLRGGRHSMSCYDMLMTVAPGNPGHARRAGAGAIRLSEQPCAAGVYHIPRAAYAGADYLDDN